MLSTLHTLDATETIMRIVSSFPSHQQKSVRIQLAGILKAVISMRLVRAAKGSGRVPAVEVMVSTALDSRSHRQRGQDFADSRSDRAWRVAIQHADIRSVSLPSASVAPDHLRRSDAQRDQRGRIQDARVGNLLDRSNDDGEFERDEFLRATAGRVRANREPLVITRLRSVSLELLCVSVVSFCLGILHHRGTEDHTETLRKPKPSAPFCALHPSLLTIGHTTASFE